MSVEGQVCEALVVGDYEQDIRGWDIIISKGVRGGGRDKKQECCEQKVGPEVGHVFGSCVGRRDMGCRVAGSFIVLFSGWLRKWDRILLVSAISNSRMSRAIIQTFGKLVKQKGQKNCIRLIFWNSTFQQENCKD